MNAPDRPDQHGQHDHPGQHGSGHDADDDRDPVLEAAGARLRAEAHPLSPNAVQVAVLDRRSRRLATLLVAAMAVMAVAALGAGALALRSANQGNQGPDLAADVAPATPAAREEVEQLVARLAKKPPVDPTTVQLVSTVSTFADCDALIGDLRTVGAEHVGSRGFGGYNGEVGLWSRGLGGEEGFAKTLDHSSAGTAAADETLGTNVQVVGVDELDSVKAAGSRIYDLDGKGNLRITDAATLEVVATLDVTPKPITPSDGGEDGEFPDPTTISEILVVGDQVVVFGNETVISKPVEGDPSATRAATSYLTVAFVDAADAANPTLTDRVRIEGTLVSARLVEGEVRLVTTSNMADLGFVMPTTPTSVAKALEQNRRSVASSTAADWIPDWQRAGADPEPLVPCERVHVPDTFSGVAMTSMVTFPVASGSFEPAGTSILAPGTTLYAGLEKVAISSEVWVDPIDRDRLKFDDWQTAIHEFSFSGDEAPGYEGSGIVDGSTIGQFAYGEIGDSLAVVTTEGTPWSQDPKVGVDLTVLTPDGEGSLDQTAKIDDLSNGKGDVTAVRFVEGRVLISTGFFGREVYVIDVTNAAEPRRAGSVMVPGDVGYFHPLPDGKALVVGSRSDTVGEGDDRQSRSWVQAHLLDVSDADAPKVVSSWERPWSADNVGADHHTFTYWPDRQLAMWGVFDTQWNQRAPRPNHAVVLDVSDGVDEVAVPVANQPDEVAPPCPSVEVPAEAQDMIGSNGIVLRCDDKERKELEWPRYQCYRVDGATVARFTPEDQRNAAYFSCSPAPLPQVARVLVVSGRPILFTDQTLEALDPTTFASTAIAYHPSSTGIMW